MPQSLLVAKAQGSPREALGASIKFCPAPVIGLIKLVVGDYAGHPKCYVTPAPLLVGMVPHAFDQRPWLISIPIIAAIL